MRSRIHNVLSRYQAKTLTQLTMSSENLDNLANLASRFVQQRSKIRDNLMSRYKNKLSKHPNSNNQSYFRYSTMNKHNKKVNQVPQFQQKAQKSRRTSIAANVPEFTSKSYTSLENIDKMEMESVVGNDDYAVQKPNKSKIIGVSNKYFRSSSRMRPMSADSEEDIFKKYK